MKHLGTILVLVGICVGSTGNRVLEAQAPDTTGLAPLRQLDSLRKANHQEYARMRTILVTAAQMTLGRLGFGPAKFSGILDSATAAAVRLYERTRKLPVTGDPLTPVTFRQLNSDMDWVAESEQRPDLGSKTFFWSDDGVIAEGPWLLDGEPRTYMVARVRCERQWAECRLAWARLGRGFLTSRALQILTESFEVERWDDAEITSRPLDYPCTRYVLRINRVQETVVMNRSTLSTRNACTHIEARDLATRLVRPDEWPATQPRHGDAPIAVYNLGPAARAAFAPAPP
jgi:Putative peptidoglycan binding domain